MCAHHTNTWLWQLTVFLFTVTCNPTKYCCYWSVYAKFQFYSVIEYIRSVIYEVKFQRI